MYAEVPRHRLYTITRLCKISLVDYILTRAQKWLLSTLVSEPFLCFYGLMPNLPEVMKETWKVSFNCACT